MPTVLELTVTMDTLLVQFTAKLTAEAMATMTITIITVTEKASSP